MTSKTRRMRAELLNKTGNNRTTNPNYDTSNSYTSQLVNTLPFIVLLLLLYLCVETNIFIFLTAL